MAKETSKPSPKKAKKKSPTQCERILAILKSGGRVTVYQLHQMGINSATARMFDLRQRGFNIAHCDKTMKNQFGVNVKYREYWLVNKPKETVH